MSKQKETAWAPQAGPQEAAIRAAFVDELFYGGAAGGGKGLRRSEPILTPFGFRPLGDLKVGSRICTTDGQTQEVIGYYERGKQPIYRLKWSDGSETVCDEDHVWVGYRARKGQKRGGERVFGMRSARKYHTRDLLSLSGRFGIPVMDAPCVFNVAGENRGANKHISRLISPYIIGVLIGEGSLTSSSVRFTTGDEEIVQRVRDELPEGLEVTTYGNISYGIKGGLQGFLADLGLWGKRSEDKFIPRIYKMATIDERWALIQGLMDSDGWCDEDGDSYYTTVSPQLADDVAFLARSLGAFVTIRTKTPKYDGGKEGQLAYTLRIKSQKPRRLFHLQRKWIRCLGVEPASMTKWLESIEPCGEEETVCIAVSHPNSLYVIDNFTVTHNSDFLLGDFAQGIPQGSAWQGVLFRQSFPSLADIVERSQEIYPLLGGKWLEGKHEWKFNSGAVLRFRQFESVNEFVKFQGHSYAWIGWDELPEWPDDKCYRRMISRLRGRAENKRIRATGNPGGVGHGWVQERFHIPNEQVDWWDCEPFQVEHGMWRMFIPSLLRDNKILMEEDPDYEARLEEVGDPELVRAWKEGDWNAIVGAYFGRNWSKVELIDSFEIPPEWPVFAGLDYGEVHPTACLWGAQDYDDNLILFNEYYDVRDSASQHAEAITASARDYPFTTAKYSRNICDPNFFVRRRVNEAAVNSAADAFAEMGMRLQRGNNNRINGWRLVNDAMSKGKVKIFKEWCPNLIRTLPKLPRDAKRPEDVDTRAEDHCFAAGTPIDTADGPIPIEDFSVGTVNSVGGLQEAVSLGVTRKKANLVTVTFEDGRSVTCTEDHRFFTDDGWTEAIDLLDALSYILPVTLQGETPCKSLSSLTQSRSLPASGITAAAPTSRGMESGSTGLSGRRSTGPFPVGSTFTISTEIAQTTTCPTSSRCGQENICRIIAKSEICHLPETRQENWPRSGTDPTTAGNGTRHTGRDLFGITSSAESPRHVSSVGGITRRVGTAETGPSSAISIAGKLRCVRVEPAGEGDVYCLNVPSTGCFTVNGGILVHNCADALRYMMVHIYGARQRPSERAGNTEGARIIESLGQEKRYGRYG